MFRFAKWFLYTVLATVAMAGYVTARAADLIFRDDFELPTFRGTNLAGMEMAYINFVQSTGPVADHDYSLYDTRVIDFYVSKRMTAFRFFFSWEGMQTTLYGSIPAANSGNYKAYFDNYKRIVDYATNMRGMQVIVEPWQADSSGGVGGARYRGVLVGSNPGTVPDAAFADFWTKMATIFKDNPLVSYGLVNEPNHMSTLSWWGTAQAAITAIRSTGSTQRIFVQGNCYTAASTWTSNACGDTDPTPHSNAYGWLNANGPGQPIADPANNIVAEVHCYLDADGSGSSTDIVSITTARDRIAIALNEAAAHGYKIYLGEMGFWAGNALAPGAWADFIDYFNHHRDTLIGFTWWAGGMPGWWDDVGATNGGHFAITPTNGATFTGDTINMQMIQNDF